MGSQFLGDLPLSPCSDSEDLTHNNYCGTSVHALEHEKNTQTRSRIAGSRLASGLPGATRGFPSLLFSLPATSNAEIDMLESRHAQADRVAGKSDDSYLETRIASRGEALHRARVLPIQSSPPGPRRLRGASGGYLSKPSASPAGRSSPPLDSPGHGLGLGLQAYWRAPLGTRLRRARQS